jgi:DnaJ-class molecular chaperone
MRLALASTTDARFKKFLDLTSAPEYRGTTLAALAKIAEISLIEFQDWRQKAQTQRILARAQEGMVEVTEDLVENAKNRDVTCDRCDGFGSVVCDSKAPKSTPGLRRIKGMKAADDTWMRDCPACKGKGVLRASGSEHAIDKLIDMTGLSSKGKGGAAVQIVQNFGGASMESAVDRMSKISFDVSDAIETEVIPVESSNSED